MELTGRPAQRAVARREEREAGSAILEGAAALAIAFLLLALLTQAAFAVVARNAAESAVAAAARQAARPGANVGHVADRLATMLRSTVPGAQPTRHDVWLDDRVAYARASVRWNPPGPGWATLTFDVRAAVPVLYTP